MNLALIGELIKLRYKLLWAKTRSRNGRIALFVIGYLFLVLVLAVVALGGFGAGLVAVRSGKAEILARAVLGGLFLNAVIGSVVLGFGMNAGFSGAALRRYPLTTTECMVAQQVVGLLDPIWILILVLELGLAFGLYVYGVASFGMGLIAVLLVFTANYLCGRTLLRATDLLMQNRGGTAILLLGVVAFSLVPSLLGAMLPNNPALLARVLGVLRFTPPFAAAALMVGAHPAPVENLALLLGWCALPFAALAAIERRPARSRATASSAIVWEDPADRVAAFFGPAHGPLVARWLRYYWRNTRNRVLYVTALPLAAFLTVMLSHNTRHGPRPLFSMALGSFVILGFMGTGKMAVNLFGYDGSGFRRYSLLPVDAAAALRAGSYTAILLNSTLIPLGMLAWVLFSGTPFDARIVFILGSVGATSLFLFNGLAVWTSILAPRRGDFNASFGNDLSAAANLLYMGGIMVPVFGLQISGGVKQADILAHWWMAAPAMALSIGFYFASLRTACAVFPAHRERLLQVTEGRD